MVWKLHINIYMNQPCLKSLIAALTSAALTSLSSHQLARRLRILLILVCAVPVLSQAELQSRLGGLAYYDTILDITWYTDANAAAATAWDDGLLPDDGWLTWASAQAWVGQLQVDGIGGWRLANMDKNDDQLVVECAAVTEQDCRDNELGYMYFHNGITGTNPGPFNLIGYGYWSNTMYDPIPDAAWLLTFGIGVQHPLGIVSDRHVWAIRDGDIESDVDADGVFDALDNCPQKANANQADKDNNGTGDACEPPRVNGIWPGDGPLGENISMFIFGEYFDATSGTTQVHVNGNQQFLVQAVSSEMLIVRMTVQENLTGPVDVLTNNGIANAPVDFGTGASGLQLNGLWPSSAAVGELVFVFGNDFDMAPGATEVRVENTLAGLAQVVDETMIIFSVPSGAMTAPVYVTTPVATAASLNDLQVLP